MREHGCDDVGVVNLPPSYRNFTTQRDQRLGHPRTVLKVSSKLLINLFTSSSAFARDGDRPGLRPGDDGQVLTHNLTADPHRFKVLKGAFKSCSGDVVVRGFKNTGLYEDVGVYERSGARSCPRRCPLA